MFIKHAALPGKRDEVRKVWEKHLKPNAAMNPGHEAYFYCYDDDPDVSRVYQQYADRQAPQEFLKEPWYAAYIAEVTPLLANQREVRAATPVWIKAWSNPTISAPRAAEAHRRHAGADQQPAAHLVDDADGARIADEAARP